MFRHAFLAFLIVTLARATPALAGGYDTPILYTARHMGMGGAAIGYVSDPSAVFHNPAGLAHTESASFSLAVSPLFGHINASPRTHPTTTKPDNMQSETAFAPFFLGGASYRLDDAITLGLGIYPVASAGGEYRYLGSDGSSQKDQTKLVFLDISPVVAFNLPGNFRLGAGYRISKVTLDRFQGTVDGKAGKMKFSLAGYNFAGFRLGAQWHGIIEGESLLKRVDLGLTYRHRTTTVVSADTSEFLSLEMGHTEMSFVLPSKIGTGCRFDFAPVALAVDFEWAFNSQNTQSDVTMAKGADDLELPPISTYAQWEDAATVRVGLEHNWSLNTANSRTLKPRVGYIYDAKTANRQYPTAFGTPPAATHSFTAGVGYEAENYEMNFAYAHRTGSTTITDADLEGAETCQTCGKAGKYELSLHGIYVDYSYYF